jgi:hypothetical protein
VRILRYRFETSAKSVGIYPETGRIHQGNDRLVLEIGERIDEMPRFFLRWYFWHVLIELTIRQLILIPRFVKHILKEETDYRNVIVDGTVGKASAFLDKGKIIANFPPSYIIRKLIEVCFNLGQIGFNIALVRCQGVGCKSPK